MENFGASFGDNRVESNFNEELVHFCRMIKAIAVKEGTPITVSRVLNDIRDDVANIFEYQEKLDEHKNYNQIFISRIES